MPRLVIIIPDKRRTTILDMAHLPCKIKTAPQCLSVHYGDITHAPSEYGEIATYGSKKGKLIQQPHRPVYAQAALETALAQIESSLKAP